MSTNGQTHRRAVLVRIDPVLLDALRQRAAADDRSMNATVLRSLRLYLARPTDESPSPDSGAR